MRRKKTATVVPEAPSNELLGITAATQGDVEGVIRFIGFFQAWMSNLSIEQSLPQQVRDRASYLAREATEARSFLMGFDAALKSARKAPGRPRKS